MHRPPAVPPNTGGKAMDGGDGHGHGHGDVDGEPSGWSFLAARAEGDGNSFEAQWLRQSPLRWWANKWIGPSGLHPSIAAAARVVQCPTVQWCTWCVCEVEIQPATPPHRTPSCRPCRRLEGPRSGGSHCLPLSAFFPLRWLPLDRRRPAESRLVLVARFSPNLPSPLHSKRPAASLLEDEVSPSGQWRLSCLAAGQQVTGVGYMLPYLTLPTDTVWSTAAAIGR